MSMPDCTFEFLPLAALRWPPSAACAVPPSGNRAFQRDYERAALPEFWSWADGCYTLRLPLRCGEERLCRLSLQTLPDCARLGVIEDVQALYQDALTGLEDRRALRLDALDMERASLVLLDIDDFKTVNDTLGHAAGDTLLRALADLLRASAHGWGARAYRLGGDEFVILGSHLKVALEAELILPVQFRFRQLVARCGMDVQGFSFGLSHAPRDGHDLSALLERADARLTVQKTDRRGALAAQLVRDLKQHPASPGATDRPHDRCFPAALPPSSQPQGIENT